MLTNTAEHFFNAHASADEAGRKIIGYRIEPIREQPARGLQTAARIECLATCKLIAGHGGGGLFLSPDVVERLVVEGRSAYDAMQLRKSAAESGR